MSDPSKPDAPEGAFLPSDAPALPLIDRVVGWLEKIDAATEPLLPDEEEA
jgi:hypothetical protein